MSKKDKRLPIEGNIPNWDTPWDNGTSAYTTTQVREFLKEQSQSKMGYMRFDEAKNRYLVFADEDAYQRYAENPSDPDNAKLVLGSFDAPAEYKARITMLTPTNIALLKDATPEPIRFTFETLNSSGQTQSETVTVTYTIVSGGVKTVVTQALANGATGVFSPGKYLDKGRSTVTITVTGTNTQASTSVAVIYQVVDMALTTDLDISQQHSADGTLTVRYKVSGTGQKYMEWYIDGIKLPLNNDEDYIVDTETDYRNKIIRLASLGLEQGVHNVQCRVMKSVNEQDFYSQTCYNDFFVCDSWAGNALVAVSAELPSGTLVDADHPVRLYGLEQYIPASVRFAVYDPANRTPSTTVAIGDTVIAEINAERNEVYDVQFTPMRSGEQSVFITVGTEVYSVGADIAPTSTGMSENTANLMCRLDAKGKSNDSESREQWSDRGVACTFSGMQWTSASGWTGDALLLAPGNSVTLNVANLFADTHLTGKTIELEVETVNVSDDDAVVMDMAGESLSGITLKASEASVIAGTGNSTSVRFRPGKRYRITWVVTATAAEGSKGYLYIYVDGEIRGVAAFDRTYRFAPQNRLTIQGSDLASVKVYGITVYNTALTRDQVLNNYILSRPTAEEMMEAFGRNNITDPETRQINDTSLLGSVPVVRITGDVPTLLNTSDKNEPIVADLELEDAENPDRNFLGRHGRLRPQGTSSMAYPIKNFRFDTKTYEECVVYNSKGEVVTDKRWAMRVNSIPVQTWCLKADYAESSSSHNTGIARLWNDALYNAQFSGDMAETYGRYPLRTRAQNYAAEHNLNIDVRTCIDGFPCVVFWRPDENSPYRFLGKYNFNNDKSTENVFGFKHPDGSNWPAADGWNVQCWEVLDNGNPLGLFTDLSTWNQNQTVDGKTKKGWAFAYESRFPDGSEDTTALHAFATWVNSCKDGDELDVEKFEAEMSAHLDVPKVAAYYVYIMRFAAVDQLVKNAMLTTEDGQHWFFINYDNDTINGLSNDGFLDIDPYTDRSTMKGASAYAFAGRNSVLWNLCEASSAFMAMVHNVDNILAAAGLRINQVLRQFDDMQTSKWCERVYNEDTATKYIAPYENANKNNLFMAQGSRRSHRDWWLSRRFYYMDGLMASDSFKSNDIVFKYENNTPPGQTFSVHAGAKVFAAFAINNGYQSTGDLITPEDVEWLTYNTGDNELNVGDVMHVFGAPMLDGFDISASMQYLKVLEFDKANSDLLGTRMRRVILGDGVHENNLLQGISGLARLTLLEELDIRGYKALALSTDDLSSLKNLKVFKAANTNIPAFRSEGAPLTSVSLPASCTTLEFRDLPRLTNAGLTFESLGTLRNVTISGCALDTRAFVSQWIAAVGDANLGECSLSLGRVDWRNASVADMIKLGSIGELNMTGVVNLAAAPANEAELERLRSIYGRDCFSDSAQLRLKAPGDIMLVAPSSVLEGSEFTVELINIAGGELTALTMTATGAAGVSYTTDTATQTMRIVVEETGANRSFPISVQCLVGGQAQALSRRVTVNKRTYPTGYVLDGDRYIANGGSTALTLEESGSGITGHCSVVWSIEDVADEGEGAVVDTAASLLEIADGGESGCTVRFREGASVSNEDVCRSATVTAKMYRGLDTDPAAPYKTVTLRVAAHNGLVAVSKAANPEVFAVCKDQNWCAHESYMTLVEAGALSDADVASKPFSSKTIYKFPEFYYFIGLRYIQGGFFAGVLVKSHRNDYGLFRYPMNATRIGGNQIYEDNDARIIYPNLTIDLPGTLTTIDRRAFCSLYYAWNIRYIYMRPIMPPVVITGEVLGGGSASGIATYPPVMYIPAESEAAYLAKNWVQDMISKGWIISATL